MWVRVEKHALAGDELRKALSDCLHLVSRHLRWRNNSACADGWQVPWTCFEIEGPHLHPFALCPVPEQRFTISGLTTNQYILAYRSKYRQWTFRTIDGHRFRDKAGWHRASKIHLVGSMRCFVPVLSAGCPQLSMAVHGSLQALQLYSCTMLYCCNLLQVDGCNGTFSLVATSRGRRLELLITAPPKSGLRCTLRWHCRADSGQRGDEDMQHPAAQASRRISSFRLPKALVKHPAAQRAIQPLRLFGCGPLGSVATTATQR